MQTVIGFRSPVYVANDDRQRTPVKNTERNHVMKKNHKKRKFLNTATAIAIAALLLIGGKTLAGNVFADNFGGTGDDSIISYSYGETKEEPKKEYPTIDKKVNGKDRASASAGETVTFTLNSNVPADLWKCLDFGGSASVDEPSTANVNNNSNTGTLIPGAEYTLVFHDIMDKKLEMQGQPTVKIGDKVLNDTQYEYKEAPEKNEKCDQNTQCTFHVTLDLPALYEAGVITDNDFMGTTAIVVSYDAMLSEDATAGTYENRSWVSWEKKIVDRTDPTEPVDPDKDPEKDPDDPGESGEDKVDVDTYKISLVKLDKDDSTKELAGAKFKLEKQNEEGKWVVFGTEQITNDDGVAAWDGLGEGSYRLTETEAPKNYIKVNKPLEVTLATDANTKTNIANVTFTNGEAPHTGGSGTLIYTIVGLIILGGAAAVLIVSRRKSRE